MPRHRQTSFRQLAQEVAGPQGYVGADQAFHEVEHLVGGQPLEQLREREVRDVHPLRARVRRQLLQHAVEEALQAAEFLFREELVTVDQVTVLGKEPDIGVGQVQRVSIQVRFPS